MYLYQFKIITTTVFIVHHLLLIVNINGKSSSAAQYFSIDDDIAISCGSSYGSSTALDGRQWIGDMGSKFISSDQEAKARSIHQHSFDGVDPIPYMEARLSPSPFTYIFQVRRPGQKFIRLHFYPASSYPGFERSKSDLFTVKAGPYTLLSNFSASLTAHALGVKHFSKEFCLTIQEEDQVFNITFSPSESSSSDNDDDDDVYAFINGIEVVSMPTGLYYTSDGNLGAHVVGNNKFRRFFIDNNTALEMAHRLNVGGRSILPVEDLGGMFRVWSEDKNYLLYSGVLPVTTTTTTLMIKYVSTVPTYLAPLQVYQTSWSMGSYQQTNQWYNFIWKLSVDLGFRYLVRLHFCELIEPTNIIEGGQKQFVISINGKMVETSADVMEWSGGNRIVVYRDYVAPMIEGGDRKKGSKDLIITLQQQLKYESSTTKRIDAVLKGIEIFKLSNPDNNLNLVDANPVSTITLALIYRIQKLQKLVLAFCSINVIITTGTVLVLTLLNLLVYHLNISESNSSRNIPNISSLSSSSDEMEGEYMLCRFSLVDIQLATNNFDDALVIGKGGFGNVFKGVIDVDGTKTVAIKRLKSGSGQGAREFQAEINVLSKLQHNHLVSLIGYCDDCREMILVYEYMPHGTLADHLHGNGKYYPLSWEQRLNICIGAACGLDFLHTSSSVAHHGIIHRDVKSSNILLDENWEAKISDFGLSRMDTTGLSWTLISTDVKGTFGYLDPDCFKTRRLTKRSDVYAFGVVLFEVLGGRRAVDLTLEEEEHSLALWAPKCLLKGTVLDQLVDPSVKEQISTHCLKGFVEIANKCLHDRPNERPTMAEVVEKLKLLITLELQGRRSVNPASTEQEDAINVGDTCSSEHVDYWSNTSEDSPPGMSWHYSIEPPNEVTNESKVVVESSNILPRILTKTSEIWRKKKEIHGSNDIRPSRVWRLRDSLWHRTRPSSTAKSTLSSLFTRGDSIHLEQAQ